VLSWTVFLLIESLLSTNSASEKSKWCFWILFAGFFDTMDSSDSPCPCFPSVGPLAFEGHSESTSPFGGVWGIPVPASEVSMRAEGLRPRGTDDELALTFAIMLPSASLNSVGVPDCGISRLDTSPASAPVNASWRSLRLAPHDSGSG